MFNFRDFLMQGFKCAVGKMADYQVILNASAYFEKGVLLEEDLSELKGLIEGKNEAKKEEPCDEDNAEN